MTRNTGRLIASWSRRDLEKLRPIAERYGAAGASEPGRLARVLSLPLRETGFDLVRDLHDCWLLASETHMALIVLYEAAQALWDKEMLERVQRMDARNQRQRSWLLTQIKEHASQGLTVPE